MPQNPLLRTGTNSAPTQARGGDSSVYIVMSNFEVCPQKSTYSADGDDKFLRLSDCQIGFCKRENLELADISQKINNLSLLKILTFLRVSDYQIGFGEIKNLELSHISKENNHSLLIILTF